MIRGGAKFTMQRNVTNYPNFSKTHRILNKKRQFIRQFFGENISKIITAVPEDIYLESNLSKSILTC
jgi:hypothetical protein